MSEEALKVVIVDQSQDAIDEARDLADTRLDKELSEGGRFRRFVSGIWKGNIAKDYYRQKYIHQELDTIQETNNVLANSSADHRTRALEATIARFQGEQEELIHIEAGEHREVQAEQGVLAQAVKGLVRDFVEGRLNTATLQEERTRLLNDYREQHGQEAAGKALVTTDNLLKIAQTVAGVVEHGESLDSAIERMQVITGEARSGVRTEARYNKVDAVIDKLAKHKITTLVTPGTLAVGVAAAASIARVGSHSVVGALTKTLVPGAAAGLWAGLRENKRVKDERAQHARERAMGGESQEGDKRRTEMETTRYETIKAVDLAGHLRSVSDTEKIRNGGDEALQAALDALAAVQARVQLSDTKRIDLVSYSGKAEVGEERLILDFARSEARRAIESSLSDEARAALGLTDERTLRHVVQERAGLISEVLTGEMTAKDEAFNKLKRKRVATATAVGFATGVIGGLLVQEAVAAVDPTRFGLIDVMRGQAPVPLANGSVHQTILEGAIRGDETTVHTAASLSHETYTTAPHGSIEVTSDHTLITNEDGTLALQDGNGQVSVEGLKVDGDGTLDQASLDKLDAAGMTVEDKSFNQDITSSTTQTVSTEQYLQNHAVESTHVTRDFWYGNDTPKVYDQNELRVYRGGDASAPGIVDGGYQYTVAGMHADGSWQGGEAVNWNQAAESGNLFVAVSGTVDSQGNPFMIPIGPDGSVNIPADSPAGQFFANENNSVAFHGKYMEIVQTSGVDTDGTVHIRPLATLVGDHSVQNINDTVTTVTTEHHADYAITTNGFDTVQDNFTEMAPITPIVSRRSLEKIVHRALSNPEVPSTYYSGISQKELRDWVRGNNGTRLKPRRRVVGDDGSERWLEADGAAVERSVQRERNSLTQYIERERAENPTYIDRIQQLAGTLAPMTDSCRVSVNVPAWMEEKNLYNLLNQFTTQTNKDGTPLDPNLFEVNVIINRKTGTEADGSVQIVKKFITDYKNKFGTEPRVNYVDVELDPPNNNVGYARKMISDITVLRSLGRTSQGEALYFESEDADVTKASPYVIRNLIQKLDANPQLDAVRGIQDRDPSYLKDNDYLFMRRRAWDFFEVLARQSRFRNPANPDWDETWNRVVTGGWNTGYTAEAYADIDGYDSVVAGEDMLIGQRIAMIRGDGELPNLEVIGTISTRSDSSPRRFIEEIVNGVGAYEDFGNEDINRSIREQSVDELMSTITSHTRVNDANKGDFESYLRSIPGWAESVTQDDNRANDQKSKSANATAMTRRILFWLGFEKQDYELSGDGKNLTINDWTHFSHATERYRSRFTERSRNLAL